ncbi:MAG: hypothetical protein COB76_03655 [Alphaproteobacteria bacterium]|nr:MAG: hypothetical protein COB76_03655 [Alphaproteobacteria bacterium]
MKLDVHIEGENIDLCIPTEEYALNSDWYSWFNDPKITRYLYQGETRNTPEKQLEFFKQEKASGQRVIFIISDKNNYIGTISLSHINKGQADMAMVIGQQCNPRMRPYISLESIARMSEYAMTEMGARRINSAQHMELNGWQYRKEILGYRLEGITRQDFIKGEERANLMRSSLIYDDYLRLVDVRGQYWDSLDSMKRRLKSLPKERFIDRLDHFLSVEGDAYYRDVFDL